MAGITPFQTVGPFFDFGLTVAGAEEIATADARGRRITVEGQVLDGAGQPVPDALLEIWQADAEGQYRSGPGFSGFGRSSTDDGGRFAFATIVPGRVPGPDGLQAPHLLVSVLARGLQTRLVTRIYFADEPSNGEDPVLRLVPEDRRATLVARPESNSVYRFDVVLQGEKETVFFDV